MALQWASAALKAFLSELLGSLHFLTGHLISRLLSHRYWYHEVAEALLDAGAAVNAEEMWNHTVPLTEALWRNNGGAHTRTEKALLRTVELLLERGADANRKGERDGQTPLHLALAAGRFPSETSRRIVEVLLEHGADSTARNDRGEPPLRHICRAGQGLFRACFDVDCPSLRFCADVLLRE
jgi:ankyrin repeat protein